MPNLVPPALLALCVLIGAAATHGAQPASPDGNTSGLVDVGGYKLYLECEGAGSPAVILVSGYRNTGEIWTVQGGPGSTMVMPAVARFTRVCTYDRPGTILNAAHLSRSDPVAMPRSAEAIVTELHELLESADVPGPHVLVAHSLGGLFARLYASTYPEDVVGLVLVDAWSEALPGLLGQKQWAAYEELARAPPPGLESYPDLERVDFGAASEAMRRAAIANPLPEMPLAVLSRGKPVALPPGVPADFLPAAFEAAWSTGQKDLAALTASARQTIATESDHYIQIEQPDLVIDAVRQVVDAVRDPASWSR